MTKNFKTVISVLLALVMLSLTPAPAEHYNIFVEGMLSTDFKEADFGIFNYFDTGESLTYDKPSMEADIAEYGQYTYEGILELINEYLH